MNGGFTHWFQITADDFTETATATAQTLSTRASGGAIYSFAVGDCCPVVAIELKTPFQDASDAAFNDCTFSIGDSSAGVASLFTAVQVNLNGTEVLNKRFVTTSLPLTGFTSAVNLTFTLNSMTAKSLVDLDVGELVGYLKVEKIHNLGRGLDAGPILK